MTLELYLWGLPFPFIFEMLLVLLGVPRSNFNCLDMQTHICRYQF